MPLYRAQVIIKPSSGLIEDASTNTYHFDANTLADLSGPSVQLTTLYDNMRTHFSNLVVQNGHEIKWYRLSDAVPRATVRLDTFNLSTAPSGAPMPTECAMVVSFQGGKVSGQPQARRRGRVYFGPMSQTSLATDAYIATATRTAAVNSWGNMLDASQAATAWKWAVYSTVNNTGVEVLDGWVENAWDTQRRRGRIATIRTPFI